MPSRLALALLAGTALLTLAGGPDRAGLRGRGPLVGSWEATTRCEEATYLGSETALYSNRPYRTDAPVDALIGSRFCRGERHGTRVWIVELQRAAPLTVLATSDYGLETRGWETLDARVRVKAAGLELDQLYRKHFEPGKYVIRQGFAATAPVLFWRGDAVRVAH
jgi:hypothetical protein